jgi:uncharacterized protein YxjI
MSNFLQTLSQASAIYVKQKFELAEIFGFETRNRYQIQTDEGEQFGYCAEPKLGFLDAIMRHFLGHWRVFNIVGTDMANQQVFRAHHPFRWFFQRLDVFGAGDIAVGSLQQRFAWLNKKFEFLDTRGRVVMTMTSPFWKVWTFPIKKGEREVSVIEKKWTGFSKELFTDADNFRVRFTDLKLTADEKLLLLAGAVFVDLLYFETKAS